jgi:hypothetical protein
MAKRNLWMVMLVCVLALGMMACDLEVDPELAGTLRITSIGDSHSKGATLTALYTGGTEPGALIASNYQWDRDGTKLNTGLTCTASEAGLYTVTLSVTGFQDTSATWLIEDDEDDDEEEYAAFLGTWKGTVLSTTYYETITLTLTKFRLDYVTPTATEFFEFDILESSWDDTVSVPDHATTTAGAGAVCYNIKVDGEVRESTSPYLPSGSAGVVKTNGLYLVLTGDELTMYRSRPDNTALSPDNSGNPIAYKKQP